MITAVYQIRSEHIHDYGFAGWELMQKLTGSENPKLSLYEGVFIGDLDTEDLEKIYAIMNEGDKPEGFRGHSLSVGDVVVNKNGKFYCDNIGWHKFDDWCWD